jgi:BirA family biotin operon repressor/biotin-[acetyl-CoA-carboxylase] ligase
VLSSIKWPLGYDKLVLNEVDSTMAEASRRKSEIVKPTWILAKHQTKGYGRRGRVWSSPRGNFSATLVIHIFEPPASLAMRSFVAALALFDSLVQVTKQPDLFSLKWPNDVLMDRRKVAGILLESGGSSKSLDPLRIGIGVNLVSLPNLLREEKKREILPISLKDLSFDISAEDFLVYLAVNFAYWETQLVESGFPNIRKTWLGRSYKLGEAITVRTPSETHQGIFEMIDESGNLVLKLEDGSKIISAGDIYFEEV